jgi:ribonuclease P protein component
MVTFVSARNELSPGGRKNYPRGMRLLRHADFERVYENGRRHFSTNLTAFYLRRETGDAARLGFTVSRALGGAVDRNRMKRRLREAVRIIRPPAGVPVDIVINPKKSLLKADFYEVLKEVGRAFTVIGKKS